MVKPIKRRAGAPPLPPRNTSRPFDTIITKIAEDIRSRMSDSTFVVGGTPFAPHISCTICGTLDGTCDHLRVPLPGNVAGIRTDMLGRIAMTKSDIIDLLIQTAHPPSEAMQGALLILQGSTWLPKHARRIPWLGNTTATAWTFTYQDALQIAEGIQPSDPEKQDWPS